MANEFRVGEVFARSLRVLFANFLSFIAISFIVTLPVSAYDLWEAFVIDSAGEPSPLAGMGIRILGVVLGPLATGAITYGVFQQLRGQRASFGQCLAIGFRRMFPVLLVALCVGLAVALGFIALIVPGLILMTMYWVAIPVAVVERVGVNGSTTRSGFLTKGSRWKILGLALLLGLVQVGVGATVGFVAGMTQSMLVLTAAVIVISVVGTAWQASAQAVSYYVLRSMKEMIDVDQIASVFD